MSAFARARRWSGTAAAPTPTVAATLCATIAWCLYAASALFPDAVHLSETSTPEASRRAEHARTDGRFADWRIGGYGGVSDTIDSVVTIANPPATNLTVRDFEWIGRPFKSPIYYGARIQRLPDGAGLGGMLDFTHAKAIARADSTATFSGTRNGQPVAPKARIDQVFRHLEFSHGHNMLTLNGMWRMPAIAGRLRPYFGGGAGISLPHTEIGFLGDNARTYEYQFAGFVGQALGGVEISLGRVSLFVEYKFSYAPYRVPLSHEPYGWLLVTDLWRQFKAWSKGEAPPGGWLDTTLSTHHGIAGIMVRLGPSAPR